MRVLKLHHDARTPRKAHESDLGFDLFALNDVVVPAFDVAPGGRRPTAVRTGVAIALKPGWGAIIKDRSGLAARKALHVLGGVIDPGYRGEIIVLLMNLGNHAYHVRAGDRVAQLVPVPLYSYDVIEDSSLAGSDRGSSGFGSTGR